MPWVETETLSFTARHDASQADAVGRVLDDLERFRDELEPLFAHVPAPVAVVIHPRAVMLSLAAPWLPLARLFSAPAARRYLAGWCGRGEIHVLSPDALEARASGVAGSREALMRTPRREYAQLVVGANNPALPPPFTPMSFRRYISAAWLSDGAAAHFAGQVPALRAAIARRLREGGRPAFPPSARDAGLLGGTVYELLRAERDAPACAQLARAAVDAGGRKAVEAAFGRPVASVERTWLDYLAELSSG